MASYQPIPSSMAKRKITEAHPGPQVSVMTGTDVGSTTPTGASPLFNVKVGVTVA